MYRYVCLLLSFTLIFIVTPSINQDISNKTINETQSVNFTCEVTGEPVSEISWYFNGTMINVSDNSGKYMIMSRSLNITTTEKTLTVYNVTSSDVGTYSCNATNIIGNYTSSGHLQVNG